MATAMAADSSGHSSRTATPTHVLQVPSTSSTSSSHRGLLPFPTSPSLPDRRSRLRRLKVSLATQNNNNAPTSSSYDFSADSNNNSGWRNSISSDVSSSISTDTADSSLNAWDQNYNDGISRNVNKRRKYRELGDGQSLTWSKERERKIIQRNERDKENANGEVKRELFRRLGPPVLPPVGSSDKGSPSASTSNMSNNGNTARSHKRNIITPRNYHNIMGGGSDSASFYTRAGGGGETSASKKDSIGSAGQAWLREGQKFEEVETGDEEPSRVGDDKGDEETGDDDGEEEEEDDNLHLRPPKVSLRRSSPPLHEDFFLTSIADYEDPPVRGRKSSTTSKESGGKEKEDDVARDPTSTKGDKSVTKTPSPSRDLQVTSPSLDNPHQLVLTDTEKTNDILEDGGDNSPKEKDTTKQPNNAESVTPLVATVSTSRIPVPIPSSRESRELRETPRDTRGLQRVYLEGLDHMRGHVTSVEEEMSRIDREFHKIQTTSGGDRMYFLKECNERLLQANSELRKHDVSLEVIDSATRMVRLMNGIRALKPPANKDLVDFLTHFWEDSKSTTEQLKALLIKFDTTVLQRLSNNYMTSHSADLKVPICQQYASDIEDFLKELGQQLTDADTLIKSYEGGIHQNLLDTNDFTEQLKLMCDLNAFPILGFVHAVCYKMSLMCQKARHWLARDEKFMHEINTFIKETRSVARRREIVLQNEKEKHKRREKNVKIAQSMLHNNREKLGMIERELKELEDKLSGSKVQQKQKTEEIHQKETMVDFLKLTLQQTKRNYSLQSKRSKLLRQVQELEDYLKTMENELETVQDMILAKSHEKILLKEKVQNSEQSYESLKTGLDKFSENLEKLEADVTSLSGQLLHLEIVHTIRTSPETLDNLIDRPSTVKLSQSLKEKIRERKRKAALKNS